MIWPVEFWVSLAVAKTICEKPPQICQINIFLPELQVDEGKVQKYMKQVLLLGVLGGQEGNAQCTYGMQLAPIFPLKDACAKSFKL